MHPELSMNTEVAAKSLATRLEWAQQRGYRAFRLQSRYNLASFRALGFLSSSLSTPLVSGLQRPVHGPVARLLAATSVRLGLRQFKRLST